MHGLICLIIDIEVISYLNYFITQRKLIKMEREINQDMSLYPWPFMNSIIQFQQSNKILPAVRTPSLVEVPQKKITISLINMLKHGQKLIRL